MLKKLLMSIEEIKEYTRQPNPADFTAIAWCKEKDIAKEISKLKQTKHV